MRVNRDLGGEIESQNNEKCADRDAELRRHEARHAITQLSSGLSQLTRVEATIAPYRGSESTRL
jgi:hypothetical protein